VFEDGNAPAMGAGKAHRIAAAAAARRQEGALFVPHIAAHARRHQSSQGFESHRHFQVHFA
jgi:hypothetical protein